MAARKNMQCKRYQKQKGQEKGKERGKKKILEYPKRVALKRVQILVDGSCACTIHR